MPDPARSEQAGSHPFLSPSWLVAARTIREKYADQTAKVVVSIRMNQVITDVPDDVSAEGLVKTFMDTSSGNIVMDLGELDTPDLTITTDFATARALFVEQDQAVAMQAFMAGRIKVNGDMMKMMAMQTGMPQDDIAKTIAGEIKEITE